MSDNESKGCTIHLGGGVGGVIAAICSWLINHSVGYAILHFFCGWFYVVWYLLKHVWHAV